METSLVFILSCLFISVYSTPFTSVHVVSKTSDTLISEKIPVLVIPKNDLLDESGTLTASDIEIQTTQDGEVRRVKEIVDGSNLHDMVVLEIGGLVDEKEEGGVLPIDVPIPIEKGVRFLEDSCNAVSNFQSLMGETRDVLNAYAPPSKETFSSAIALDLLSNIPVDPAVMSSLKIFLPKHYKEKTVNFFTDITRYRFPDDVDATALSSWILFRKKLIKQKDAKETCERIIDNVDEEGIIQVYFPYKDTGRREDRGGRRDHVVCANALRLIYQLKLGSRALKTEKFVYETLENESFLDGSRYYPSPDIFLYFLSRAVVFSERETLLKFSTLITRHLEKRLGVTECPLDMAARILTAQALGLLDDSRFYEKINAEKEKLEALQAADGSWPKKGFYKLGKQEIFFGSEAVTTLFAVSALHSIHDHPQLGKRKREGTIIESGSSKKQS